MDLTLDKTMAKKMTEVEVEQAIRDWNAASQPSGMPGVEGYASYFTEDAVWLPSQAPLEVGREAIMVNQTIIRLMEKFTLHIEPTRVEASESGDMAVGMGTWSGSFVDEEGVTRRDTGKFMDVWRRQSDGSMKCIAGMDNTNQPVDQYSYSPPSVAGE
jgi:ketosteroid isomerase-like protein